MPDIPLGDGPTGEEGRSAVDEALAAASLALNPDTAPPSPTPATPAGRVVLDALGAAARAARNQVAVDATATAALLNSSAIQQTQTLRAEAADQSQTVADSKQQARQQVKTSAGTARMQLRESEQNQRAKLSVWRRQSVATAQQYVGAAAHQVRVSTTEKEEAATEAGQSAASTVSGTMSGAAATAERGTGAVGTGKIAKAHAEVDRKVSEDAAGQLRTGAGDAGAGLRTQAVEAAQTLRTSGERTARVLALEVGPLTSRVDDTATTATATIAAGATQTKSHMRGAATVASQDLRTTADTAVRMLRTQSDAAQGAVNAAAAAAIRFTTSQATQAMRDSRTAQVEAAQHLAEVEFDQPTAAELAEEIPGQLDVAHEPINTGLREIGTNGATALGDAGQRARVSLGQMGPTVAGTLREGAGLFAGQTLSATQGADRALDGAVQAATGAGNDLIQATSQHLTRAAAQVDTAMRAGASALNTHLSERCSDATTRAQDAVSGSQARVREGQARVDAQQTSGRAVQRFLGGIGDWVSDQLGDLWNMLKSPSFWAGLIVTLLLLPVLGPGAFVIGGVVGGAVSGIEDNVRQDRPWYTPGPIIRGAAIGGLAGAAIAFGFGVIVGLGLEGVAAAAATMGLVAVVGIVANVATGERWDRGLVANLFLAWLFHRIGGRGRAAPKETVPPLEATPGGRVSARARGLYEAINPNEPPPGGWRFNDTVSELGKTLRIKTDVTSPDGKTGWMVREVETNTSKFTMAEAFLDDIPSRWVQTDQSMVPGRGTPLEAYMTMRIMRIMEMRGSSFSHPRTVHMSTIINTKTCLQLASAEAAGTARNFAILDTHSVQYANNSIVQSGGRVTAARVTGGFRIRARELDGVTSEMLTKFGVRPDQQVPYAFSVDLTVVPAEVPAVTAGAVPNTTPPAQHPLPVPVPPGGEDR